jgi:hypothetical protein
MSLPEKTPAFVLSVQSFQDMAAEEYDTQRGEEESN